MDSLHGKGALVTGAASGIGRAIATTFIDAGASVLLCDANYRAVEVLARQLGDRAIGRVTDVSDERQVAAALRAARATFGTLDIVVNCAGFGAIAPLTELTDETWQSVQAATLGDVLYGVKHGARQMLEQGRPGVIINISSVNARQPGEEQVVYCAATAGVDMITRCAALQLGSSGCRLVDSAPGLVETPLTRKEPLKDNLPDSQANVVSPILMRHGASRLLQFVEGAIARDWLRDLLKRANALCEEH